MEERKRKLYGVASAGLLHDIGKLYQRADDFEGKAFLTTESRKVEDQACPPHWDGSGRRTHKHAVWTAAFWERHSGSLPLAKGIRLAAHEMDTIENVSSYHHNPTSGHPWQELMQIADHCSSGMDRTKAQDADSDEKGKGNFKSKRLLASWRETEAPHEHALGILTPEGENVFPTSTRSDEDQTAKYSELARELDSRIDSIKFQYEDKEQSGIHESLVELRYEALQSALEHTTWCVPSSTIDIPDISLFDHLRGTAAIAVALADFVMNEQDVMDAEKFGKEFCRFAVLDLAGIQKFIYDMEPTGFKGMAKVLRARSFFVNAMLEAVEIALLKELKLPRSQTLMNGGGKLVLLLPNRDGLGESIQRFQARLEKGLIETTHGRLRVHIGLGDPFGKTAMVVNPEELKQAYDSAFQDLAIKRLRPFAARIQEVDSARGERFEEGKEPCKACGKMMINEHKNDVYCSLCFAQKQLGEDLVSEPFVHFLEDKDNETFPGTGLKLELYDKPRYLKNLQRVYRLWDPEVTFEAVPLRYVAHYVPRKNGEVKSFEDLADEGISCRDGDTKKRGIRSLGVLAADVDNLGQLFGSVLSREKGGLTTLIGLSRQLNFFFGGVLQNKLHGSNIYTVYAGGDDMFFIGTWDALLDAVGEWRTLFHKFTCGTQHFSAGIALAKPGVPVNRLHDEVEEQLKLAKREIKNRVSIWGRLIGWEDWNEVVKAKDKFTVWRLDDSLSVGQIYRVLNYARRARRISVENSNLIDDAMWLPHMRYDIGRNLKDKEDKGEIYEYLNDLTMTDNKSFSQFYDIALSWAIYLTREAGEGKKSEQSE